MTQEANLKLRFFQLIWIPFMIKNKMKVLECHLKIRFKASKQKKKMVIFTKMEERKELKSPLKC